MNRNMLTLVYALVLFIEVPLSFGAEEKISCDSNSEKHRESLEEKVLIAPLEDKAGQPLSSLQFNRVNQLKYFFGFSLFTTYLVLPIVAVHSYSQFRYYPLDFSRAFKGSYFGVLLTLYSFSTYGHYQIWENICDKESALRE